jgi:hypothetical protein
MPRYSNSTLYGYDLNTELEVCYANFDIGAPAYILGSQGSFILVCPNCGNERYRTTFPFGEKNKLDDHVSAYEHCFTCQIPMIVYSTLNRERIHSIWKDLKTIEALKQERLQRESCSAGQMICFGNKTEADFPKGYVEKGIVKS